MVSGMYAKRRIGIHHQAIQGWCYHSKKLLATIIVGLHLCQTADANIFDIRSMSVKTIISIYIYIYIYIYISYMYSSIFINTL